MIDEGNARHDEYVNDAAGREEIYSKAVRAGKRTYFFDVKATRRNDYYLTITESKKRFNKDGKHFYEKHKLFLYKEDFDKFAECLSEMIGYIREANPQPIEPDEDEQLNAVAAEEKDERDFTSVKFEDLGA
ncbi:MAG: DNA-binding protein [Bacteroidetes bacterium]|nr:MAG: DNA-binding protein [Bacteroidota bacterium]